MPKKPIKAPAYQWYPKDILTSVRVAALSDLEELWYRRALDFCWLNVTLPNDPIIFARIIGRGCTVEGAKAVMELFQRHSKNDTLLIHDRQQSERKKQAKNRKQRSDAGVASAEKRRKQRELDEQQTPTQRATAVEISFNENPTLQSSNSSNKNTLSKGAEKKSVINIDLKDAENFGYPLEQLFEKFPDLTITPAQLGMIVVKIKNEPLHQKAWSQTIEKYHGNFDPTKPSQYNPAKIGTLLSVFEDALKRLQEESNGKNKSTSAGRFGNGGKPSPGEVIANRSYRNQQQ